MKRVLFFCVFSLLAGLCMAEYEGYLISPFAYYIADYGMDEFENISAGIGLGLGISVPFLFNGKVVKAKQGDGSWFDSDIYSYFVITPTVAVDYSFLFVNMLRIRGGASFGKTCMDFISFGYHAGVSGVFMKDFANDVIAFGISPTISVELSFLIIRSVRLQAQYDFYTIERYNRFVLVVSCVFTVDGNF